MIVTMFKATAGFVLYKKSLPFTMYKKILFFTVYKKMLLYTVYKNIVRFDMRCDMCKCILTLTLGAFPLDHQGPCYLAVDLSFLDNLMNHTAIDTYTS